MGSGRAEENPRWMCLGCFGRGTWAMWNDNTPWHEFNHIPGWRSFLFGWSLPHSEDTQGWEALQKGGSPMDPQHILDEVMGQCWIPGRIAEIYIKLWEQDNGPITTEEELKDLITWLNDEEL
jgi:hypothetical protein